MGTQQILLIVMGTIAVGIAIFAGINLYTEYVRDQNRQQVNTTLYQLANMAIAHYKKPTEMGGGGGSYSGFSIPRNLRRNEIGRFSANVRRNRVNFNGRGVEKGRNGRTVIRLILRLRPSGISFIDRN